MTQDEFIAAIKKMGFGESILEKQRASRCLGVSLRTFQRVYHGEQDCSALMRKLVNASLRYRIEPEKLERL